ncbi:cell division protein CpoB [Pragia fontium]|uniref:Cell division coordinator CpoB n=2 Tax=Pragia fontium TaxID=82985 RepID=A0AAJ4W977_9GAMM|nr:cell division protein CpoB [Pragia fontium]AKJ41930.1 tol-pal system protein [Pragia fontium]SFC41198.1 tol-pal system protein YbgF [Pragia fontium DSM 5563 = ATCC 49100]SUB82152.1 tol-pal system protein YbgF [Pragia fontium]VEJ54842.1 tol-pal system protein YbgF [Pragia fontium]GKX62049.1 cell division protein CpoB [Pragia fontium]
MNRNFRYHVLSLSLLVGIAAPVAAIAASTDDRITQLERISDAHGQLLTQLQQQLSDSQRDIDTLRGQIQTNQYQLDQIVERQKIILQQIDELGSKGSSAATPANNTSASATTSPAGTTATAAASTGNEKQDYDNAVTLALEKKQYDNAITAFQSFVKQYPKSSYQPNANYWLGQLYYNKNKKDDASYYFASVVKDYPKSPKAAESMLKVGIIMQEKGEKDKAKAVYQRIISLYANSASAKQAEKRLAGL